MLQVLNTDRIRSMVTVCCEFCGWPQPPVSNRYCAAATAVVQCRARLFHHLETMVATRYGHLRQKERERSGRRQFMIWKTRSLSENDDNNDVE